MRRFFHIIGLVAVLALNACATTPDLPPQTAAVATSEDFVGASIDLAREESDAVEPIDVIARYNPAPCDCPEYEIRVWGAWKRAYLVGSTAFRERLATFAENEKSGEGLEFLTITGTIAPARKRSSRNVPFLVFEAEEP